MHKQTVDAELMHLTGAIYDAVIDPKLWWPALEQLRRHFWFHFAVLGMSAIPSAEILLNVAANLPEEYLSTLPRYGGPAMDIWGGVARIGQLPLEEPLLTSNVLARSKWDDNSFYREWARPQGIVDQVAIFLVRDHDSIAHLGLAVHESRREVTEEDMAGLRLLAPHLARAAIISRILDRRTEEAGTFRGALEAIATGAVLVDTELTILYSNPAAEMMLRAGDPIVSVGRRLAVTHELVRGRLEEAVRIASEEEARLARRGIGIAAQRADGTPVVVNVMPLERRALRDGAPQRAAAAIFVAPAHSPAVAADMLALLFGLTPAEVRVYELIVAGQPTETIAKLLGVAISTVRTHLLSVFDKTGRHSRAELLRLSTEIAVPT